MFCQFISWSNWVNSGKFMDNGWTSRQIMAEKEIFYEDLIIIKLYKNMFVQLSISPTARRTSILNAISWNQFCRSIRLKFKAFAFSGEISFFLHFRTVVFSMFHQNLVKTLVNKIENSASELIQLIVSTMKDCTTTLHFKIMLSNNWSIETKRAVFIISRCYRANPT